MAMLGSSCSTCCAGCCKTGTLPDTITLTISGEHPDTRSVLPLEIVDCYGSGSGAAGFAEVANSPGALTAVRLTNRGQGYGSSVMGRRAPVVSASLSESGGTVEPDLGVSLQQQTDDCGGVYWRVSGVTVSDAGDGDNIYDGQPVAFTVLEEDTTVHSATGCATVADLPTIGVDFPESYGAKFSVTLVPFDNPALCEGRGHRIESVTITDKGTYKNYHDFQNISFTVTDGIELQAADGRIRITPEPPTATVIIAGDGSGAEAKVEWEMSEDVYRVSQVTITQAGIGWTYASVTITTEDAEEWTAFLGTATQFGPNGGILAIRIDEPGEYFKSSEYGSLDSVLVDYTGHYAATGKVSGVIVSNGGHYYRSDLALPTFPSPVKVRVANGNGSESIEAVVDTTSSSSSFGQITSLSITKAGSGYTTTRCGVCPYPPDSEAGDEYSIVAYRTGCQYVGYRCWKKVSEINPDTDLNGVLSGLVVARFSSKLREDLVALNARTGIPGVHDGPLKEQSPTVRSYGYAIPGRLQVVPTKLFPGDVTVSCEMQQKFSDGWLPYWEIASVEVPPGVTQYSDGEQLVIYAPELSDSSQPPGIASSANNLNPPVPSGWLEGYALLPLRKFATGAAQVDGDGQLAGITLSDRGVLYKIAHSNVAPAIAPEVSVTISQAPPSNGSGAAITPVVDTNTSSATFGRLIGQVTNRGSGYIGSLQASNRVVVSGLTGGSSIPVVQLFDNDSYPFSCRIAAASEPVANCSSLSFTANGYGMTVGVAGGGSVTPTMLGRDECCGKCGLPCNHGDFTQIVFLLTRESSSGTVLDTEQGPYGITCPEDSYEIVHDVCNTNGAINYQRHGQPDNIGGPSLEEPDPTVGGLIEPFTLLGGEERVSAHISFDLTNSVGIAGNISTNQTFASNSASYPIYMRVSLINTWIGRNYSSQSSSNYYSLWWTDCPSSTTSWTKVTGPTPAVSVGHKYNSGYLIYSVSSIPGFRGTLQYWFPNLFDYSNLPAPFTNGNIGVPLELTRVCKDYELDISFQ